MGGAPVPDAEAVRRGRQEDPCRAVEVGDGGGGWVGIFNGD